jgi:PAS domain S-box-containing protein
VGRLRESDAQEATAPTAQAAGEFCRAVLAGVPGGAVMSFDPEWRVHSAEGKALARAGLGPMVGRRLPDLMPAASWETLRAPFEAAIHGRTTRFDFGWAGSVFSIHVSPFLLPGEVRGAIAVSHTVSRERILQAAALEREAAIQASNELLRIAFDCAPAGMSVIGPEGRCLRVNDECCRMLGYEREELVGAYFTEFSHPDDQTNDRALIFAGIACGPDSLEREMRYLRKDGAVVWVNASSHVIANEAGEPAYLVVHLRDVTERRVAQQLRRQSDRKLHAILDSTPNMVSVKGRDHRYELVNRGFEEWCGLSRDRILGRTEKEMPWGLQSEVRHAKDQEVLDGADPMQDEETILRDGEPRVYLTTRFPIVDERGQIQAVCCSSTDITERRDEERTKRERTQCSSLIHDALAQERLVLHGQPIINLVSMQVDQAELLVRMRRPHSDELMAPAEFLPAAERFGLIGLIDEWVVDQAIRRAAAGYRVEVNLSAKTISDAARVNQIEQAIRASGAPPENLIFEITESAVADHIDAAREFALRLRQLGCAFALDDFGVGHGTFTYLKHLAVDYLKIDIQFVRDLLTDEADRDVIQAIIGVARQFDVKTIAEGVEDEATLTELQRMGVDYAQGYWIGRPAPLDHPHNSIPREGK